MENYKEKYECALETIQEILSSGSDSIMMSRLKLRLQSVFPELKESEDEKIRNQIINFIEEYGNPIHCEWQKDWIAWLEKQGEYVEINPTEFDTRLQALIRKFETLPKEELVGSLSFWLNVVQNDGTYKADEKQDKQNPCETCSSPRLNCQNFPCEKKKNFDFSNKIEPKFKVGDTIVEKDLDECDYGTIKEIKDGQYIFTDGSSINIDEQGRWQLVITSTYIEQKPTDKVEPRFKVGDWIITPNNAIKQIERITFGNYHFTDKTFYNIIDTDNNGHCWTIQDTKDGDVLIQSNKPFIYNGNYDCYYVGSYCGISVEGKFKVSTKKCFWAGNSNIYPATKEQRDTLMKAMSDAGYTFDFDKKELKKIEQKSAWSEEDERMYKSIIYSFNHNYPLTIQQQEFVKSIKPQPKQKWSEEDEKMFSELLSSLLINASDQWVKYGKWLKTLKERITWKPTEAQLVSLTIACDRNDRIGFDLTQLLKELKKL